MTPPGPVTFEEARRALNDLPSHSDHELTCAVTLQRFIDACEAERKRARELLGLDQPWPLRDVIAKLADAADHLMNHHCCDTDGWEEICTARDRARAFLERTAK